MPNPKHIYDPEKAKQIKLLSGFGLTHEKIGIVVGVSEDTLERHYRRELNEGAAVMEGKLTRTAYQLALEDRNPAMIMFLLKTRYGYRETNRQEVKIETGERPISAMSDEELQKLIKGDDKRE